MSKSQVKKIAVLAYPNANSLDVVGPLQVFASAKRYLERFAEKEGLFCNISYDTEIIGLAKGPVTLSPGFDIVATRSIYDDLRDINTFIIAGGDGYQEQMKDSNLCGRLRETISDFERFASVCTGAFIIASAGLLDQRRATTHWRYSQQLQKDFPEITVEPDAIYVKDENLFTSGGVTAGIDLSLAMIEEDCGPRLSLAVAREIVACKVRLGGQSQYSTQLEVHNTRHTALGNLLEWISSNLDQDLSVETLAEFTAMSPRNFARVFVREVGVTPAKYVERTRLEAARVALEETHIPLALIAENYGFGHPETMRRVFLRHLKVGPKEYRDRFHIQTDQSGQMEYQH